MIVGFVSKLPVLSISGNGGDVRISGRRSVITARTNFSTIVT